MSPDYYKERLPPCIEEGTPAAEAWRRRWTNWAEFIVITKTNEYLKEKNRRPRLSHSTTPAEDAIAERIREKIRQGLLGPEPLLEDPQFPLDEQRRRKWSRKDWENYEKNKLPRRIIGEQQK